MSLYLKANSEIQTLQEYNGEKGRYLKTFAINDKRNKNGWRVTWPSIKKYIHTFFERPGIEYISCNGTVCDLDHTEGTTKEISLQTQEDFRKTTIIDYTINESTHTAFFIHKVLDDSTWEKLQNQQLKFVSPSIWPRQNEYSVMGEMPNGLPKIDVSAWDGLHTAFVNEPAFGDDAKIIAMCEGENCHMKLLSAKQISADELDPLRQIPILVRHKGKLRFVSVHHTIAEKINANYKKDIAINEEVLLQILNEEKPNLQNNSFKAYSCASGIMENKELESKLKSSEEKVKELESKLKSNDESHTTKVKELESKLQASEKDDAANDDEKLTSAKQATQQAEKERDEAKTANEETKKENETLKAKIAEPLIAKIMLNAKEKLGEEQSQKLEKSLQAKTLSELDELIMMNSLSANVQESPQTHFEFSDGPVSGALSAKTAEEIFDEKEVTA